ncbi:S-methyl-5'-thioadenosine phosphorylase [Stackebrandtia nassauensis]|uniref:Purine nucleoside phosphorylase n=1 Tax=Stackebrandtia nassauensis (strain DSM 44728 / CIP 108903 / NRRL B-16338 / NBRC 102104 / LLR-40K-21) TaxID=446470 RepID=D3Q9B7_STANL|nr:S-methyl-5'-thioadenosine phosphorylase [Stackebrandtia nassauensis]ADD42599.1 methylthioadenosine phosphorylase [Stackebrandtia nassauensis DSM 44728]
MSASVTRLGIIGGSGLYELLDDPRYVEPETPYGPASAPIALGRLSGREVAFLPRHGASHEHPPHRVNYRANLWALDSLGVTRVIGVSAVGSLDPAIEPGTLVVPDQVVDRTHGRDGTYFDGPRVAHASFADPYCVAGRELAVDTVRSQGWPMRDAGTLVVIGGPRFSSRAESLWYQAQGWSIVGMTAMPEVALARELGLCYVPLCLVTDVDAGVAVGEGVTQEEVFAAFAANIARIRELLRDLVAKVGDGPDRACAALKPQPL